jgi:hypothetical protein
VSLTAASSSGRACNVCRHPQRADIERTLSSGTVTYRATARIYGMSRESVRRHVDAHLDVADREAVRAVSPTPALDLAEALADVAEHAADVRRDADARGDDALALRAGRSEIDARAMLADRLGISTRDALAEITDARDLLHAVVAAMSGNPAVADTLADALADLGRTVWSRDLRQRAASIQETNARALETA